MRNKIICIMVGMLFLLTLCSSMATSSKIDNLSYMSNIENSMIENEVEKNWKPMIGLSIELCLGNFYVEENNLKGHAMIHLKILPPGLIFNEDIDWSMDSSDSVYSTILVLHTNHLAFRFMNP